MQRLSPGMIAVAFVALLSHALSLEEIPWVHAVVDLGYEFTSYADSRFHQHFLPEQPINW